MQLCNFYFINNLISKYFFLGWKFQIFLGCPSITDNPTLIYKQNIYDDYRTLQKNVMIWMTDPDIFSLLNPNSTSKKLNTDKVNISINEDGSMNGHFANLMFLDFIAKGTYCATTRFSTKGWYATFLYPSRHRPVSWKFPAYHLMRMQGSQSRAKQRSIPMWV